MKVICEPLSAKLCREWQRKTLERPLRYNPRPALANDRVQINAAGQVKLKRKTPWRDGTTHQVMSPLEFIQGLAALVPRPRLHLIRFGGRVTSLREMSVPPLRAWGAGAYAQAARQGGAPSG
jgi:Putative transposase